MYSFINSFCSIYNMKKIMLPTSYISNQKMRCYNKRLNSLIQCPFVVSNLSIRLAAYGFYYSRSLRKILCFCCNFEQSLSASYDTLWERHTKASPKCVYISLGEQNVIDYYSISYSDRITSLTKLIRGNVHINTAGKNNIQFARLTG
jgi:hypothetical protein